MKDNQYAVIIVYSTNHALKAEKLLKKTGIRCKLIPVPRQLSSDCGVCVRINQDDVKAVENVLQTVNVEIDQICII